MNLIEAFAVLANRPECEHGLNGPCAVCGPSLTLAEAIEFEAELSHLIDTNQGDTP